MRVYVAGLYSRNEKGKKANIIEILANIRHGIEESRILIEYGFDVYCPFLDFLYGIAAGYNMLTEEDFKRNSMAWLKVSDAVYVISGKGLGGGVDDEIQMAGQLNIPVYFTKLSLLTAKKKIENPY